VQAVLLLKADLCNPTRFQSWERLATECVRQHVIVSVFIVIWARLARAACMLIGASRLT